MLARLKGLRTRVMIEMTMMNRQVRTVRILVISYMLKEQVGMLRIGGNINE